MFCEWHLFSQVGCLLDLVHFSVFSLCRLYRWGSLRGPLYACVSIQSTLHLLLGADVAVVTTLALAAVGSFEGQLSVALAADHFIALVRTSQLGEGRLNTDRSETTSTQSEHQVQSGLLLDVIVGKGASIFELLARKDQTLLIGRNSLLVLNFGPVFNKLTRLDIIQFIDRLDWGKGKEKGSKNG